MVLEPGSNNGHVSLVLLPSSVQMNSFFRVLGDLKSTVYPVLGVPFKKLKNVGSKQISSTRKLLRTFIIPPGSMHLNYSVGLTKV